MTICKYCKKEMEPYTIYNICTNPTCYFYAVLKVPYDDKEEDKKPVKSKASKFKDVLSTGRQVFSDIKTEMSKTMQEAGDSMNNLSDNLTGTENQNKSKNKVNDENDPFKTDFYMDVGI